MFKQTNAIYVTREKFYFTSLLYSNRRMLVMQLIIIAQNTCGYDLMRYTIRLSKIKYENEL